jgi:hypothetical protein
MVWDYVNILWINFRMKWDEKTGSGAVTRRDASRTAPNRQPDPFVPFRPVFSHFKSKFSETWMIRLRIERRTLWECSLERKSSLIYWKWLSTRESWWYPLRHTSTRRTSAAWIAWGLPVCCGCLITSVGSTEGWRRVRKTCEENEISWHSLHVGNPEFILLVYSHFFYGPKGTITPFPHRGSSPWWINSENSIRKRFWVKRYKTFFYLCKCKSGNQKYIIISQ